ncbi:unnamed protein product [Mytilus coruscus]|uniref:YqaJ viral recombinase domain-containing protein n=1 Tax=Mytilus coruscus TaxID=42192 RepID=A0A6J8B8L1_MYTCO|nr:unnamed protein product [Mytilus coruscus]
MSGLKHLGQVLSHETNLGHYDTSLSKINFIVPSRAILDTYDSCLKSSCKTPGIMIPLIENIATKRKHIRMPFKLSIDLKKLNPGGKFGDVNCFGFENTPTFDQRQPRLQKEFQCIQSFQTAVEQNSKPSSCIQDIGKCLGLRQKDLKTLSKKRQYALDKIKQEAGDRWRDSKYAFILSSLQTSLYEIRRTITAIQLTTKNLLQIGAYFSGFAFPDISSVDLSEQLNYKRLIGMDKEMPKKYNIPTEVYCQFVKQGSEEWFNIRSGAMVTGSTVYNAIGLDSLKAEQRHYDEVVRGKPKEIPSDEVQKRMDHGTRNEINAIATLISVVLPTFYSAMTFHEEGCYIIDNQGKKFCVVSPDGSLRMNARPVIAVEIKCPSPQTFNSEEPYYRVPVRYVLQMMMEMFVLKVSTAILVCWMPKTTSVLDVPFSQAIWEKMWKIILNIYSPEGLKRPTSLHSDLKDLKADLQEFVDLQCKFVCEVPSYVGNECHHENMNLNNTDDLFITHETSAIEIMSIFSDCEKHLHASYSLCRDIAKQVFVVMLSDVDRLFKPEIPHACPVAYGFTGYSFKADQASKILSEVRKECGKHGLNIVAQCYDGAFAKLAVKGINNEPLTLLQLSKDIWKSASNTSKPDIIREIASIGVVQKLENLNSVLETFDVEVSIETTGGLQSINGPIMIGKPKNVVRFVETPCNWRQLLQVNMNLNKATNISNVTADTVTTAVMQNAEINQHDLTEGEQIQLLSCSDNDDNDPLQRR